MGQWELWWDSGSSSGTVGVVVGEMGSQEDAEALETYKVQLQQVEAALLGDEENAELLKLKTDLDEVIKLTTELVEAEVEQPGSSTSASRGPVREWKPGDRCMAIWHKNGKHHEATIDGISDGKAAVTFVYYNSKEINALTDLRDPPAEKEKKNFLWEQGVSKSKRAEWAAEKERRRKRTLKKAQRLKDIEEQKEKEKKGWKDFNSKASHKKYKGMKKTSIFASTEESGGKIGVGTCGISGRPMTNLTPAERMAKRQPHPF